MNGNGHQVVNYSGIVKDVIFARLVTLPFFDGFTARRSPQFPTQEMHLPYLGVYAVAHDMEPEGPSNEGHIAFIAYLRLAISVQKENNDTVALERELNEAFWQIMSIFPDQYSFNLIDTYDPNTGTRNPENMRIEGIDRITSRINWAETTDNQMPWAELQCEMLIKYGRPYFAPGPFDELTGMRVEVVPLREEWGMWRVREFAHIFEQTAWIAANEHRYQITILSETAVEYREISPRPSLPTAEEVQRVIMRYEFIPGQGAKERPYPPDPP